MPFPDINRITYQKVEDEGRTCPICGAQMKKLSDGYKSIIKCYECGYSRKFNVNDLGGQHRYDQPVMLVGSVKTSWFELFQSLDEALYNSLVDRDYTPEEAASAVIKDLEMNNDETKYFMDKLQFLETVDSNDGF